MNKTLLCFLAVSGLLAFIPNKSKAQNFGFEVSVGPGYYGGGRCSSRYYEDRLTITIDPLTTTAITTIARRTFGLITKATTIVAITAGIGKTRIDWPMGLPRA